MWIKCTINILSLCGVRFSHFQRGNTFVIGIGGTTNGGKTSLVSRISKHFPSSECIHMDDYFYPQDKIPFVKELGYKNYDTVDAINFEKLFVDVVSWIQLKKNTNKTKSPSMLFVEGILVLNHKPLLQIFDLTFYMDISRNECIKRRLKRQYPTPDPVGYFDDCLWPMHLRYHKELEEENDIVRLNGELPSETIDHFVENKILSVLSEKYDDS